MERNKIFVESFYSYKSVVDDFGETTGDVYDLLSKPEEFKLVLFSGGEDVNPALYGHESPDRLCFYRESRDQLDIKIFKTAQKNNIKMTGICRGLQFLNVMSGGTMIHHLDKHEGCSMHSFISPRMDHEIYVNSLHHQMVVPSKDAFIIGSTEKQIATVCFGNYDQPITKQEPDVEALYMPTINACGVQYHPEMMHNDSEGFKFFHRMINEFLHLNNTEFKNKYTTQNNKVMCVG